jgi:hypothetical protein
MSNPNLTFGENAVGLGFNPGGDPKVDKIKTLYAEIIDILNSERYPKSDNTETNEINRLLSIAITEAQGSQMWAVKSLTWK